jgi:Tat protein secretion system quality control protein TatD with DNase activity
VLPGATPLLIDSHAHLQLPEFDADREAVLRRAREAGVTAIINIGIDLATSRDSLEIARHAPDVFTSLGVHPNASTDANLDADLAEIEALAADPKVVAIGEIDATGQALLDRAEATIGAVGSSLEACHFRQAIREILALAQEANRYLDETAPWKAIKTDRQAAATSLYVSLSVISALKTMFLPILPFTSQRLHEYLGFNGPAAETGWVITPPPPGQPLLAPQALFTKLEDSVVEEENARMQRR